MPHHPLIEDHLRQLRRALPTETFEELAAGLEDTYDHFLAQGLDTRAAARAALADFGTVTDITAAYDHLTPGRHAARILLATGPLVGACWATALLSGHAWTWPIPLTARLGFAAALPAVIALLAITARRHYRHVHRAGAAAGAAAKAAASGVVLIDIAIITTAALCAPTLTWPLALAIGASLTRAALTAPALRTLIS